MMGYRPIPQHLIGPSVIGELLLVDVRVAKEVRPGSELYDRLLVLLEKGGCGTVESTFVVDLLEADDATRAYLLDRNNWPHVKTGEKNGA